MEFTRRPLPTDFSIHLNDSPLRKVEDQRHLGLLLSADLRWTLHVNRALSKGARFLHTVRRLRGSLSLSKQALTFYYCSYIRPVLEYASIAWPGLPAHLRDRLERFQRQVFKVILRLSLSTQITTPCCSRSTRHLYNLVASIRRLSSDSILRTKQHPGPAPAG